MPKLTHQISVPPGLQLNPDALDDRGPALLLQRVPHPDDPVAADTGQRLAVPEPVRLTQQRGRVIVVAARGQRRRLPAKPAESVQVNGLWIDFEQISALRAPGQPNLVAYGLRLHGKQNKSELDGLIEQSLRNAALWDEVKDRLHSSALGLSGGQQQRLCIARAIAIRPEIILMDEPASALDPIATTRIEELILELKRDFTIVIVTHNMQQAARISDQTAFFYLGELIEFDTTAKIFTNPAKKQTEDYVTGRFG